MIPYVGLASGLGAGNDGCRQGPLFIQEHLPNDVDWKAMIQPKSLILDKWEHIPLLNQELAQATLACATEHPFTIIIGGDHSCAIGTWSGIAEAARRQGQELGLIWLDAHMDSHTPESSESGNIHGMPLASLLGIGSSSLTQILSEHPKLKPQNVFLVGIRSFETPEKELLERLGVRIYWMDEVHERGLKTVLAEVVENLSTRKIPYGISADIDFFDPSYMSATGTPVEKGANPDEFIQNYSVFETFPPIAFEFVEFNPDRDTEGKSLHYTLKILERVASGRTATCLFCTG
jgi:arginase